jgi:predicted methyltransferase
MLLVSAAALIAGIGLSAAAPVVSREIAGAVAAADRPDTDKARDADRKPGELVAFAGIKPGMKVAELAPGGGYFTRILSGAVGPRGKVFALSGRPSPAVEEYAKTHPNVVFVGGVAPGTIPVPEPVDVVWTTLNYHDFKNAKVGDGDAAAAYNSAAFKALKPGGIYLIGDHDAAKGAGATVTSSLHRIEGALVIKEVEAAGFKLEAQSDLLRHPADDHTARVQETGIRGKTDQFVLRFRKPR